MANSKNKTELPEGVTLAQLKENWDLASREHQTAFRRIRLLDAADRGRIWEVLKNGFPPSQILPDTNFVSYVKNNLMASIYTVGKSASLIPTTPDDKTTVTNINLILSHYWDISKIGLKQMLAGERAALTNMGIIQVGWDPSKTGGKDEYAYDGALAYKNIDPTKFMRDPYAPDLESSAYCMTFDVLHKSVLKANPKYKDVIDAAINNFITNTTASPIELNMDKATSATALANKDYFRLVTHWVRVGEKFHEIHTLNNETVLYVIEDVRPGAFPFAILYCNPPSGDLVGTSECARVFANSVAYNILNSVLLTSDYKNQRPPKYVSAESGINIPSLIKHGNDADHTFVVNGPANNAVHYHQFPTPSPGAPAYMAGLAKDVQMISGVDGRYTGRDSGSILTTGGVEAMINQATLVDEPKVMMYELFTTRLTELTLGNLLEFGPKRRYFVHDSVKNKDNDIVIDFPALDKTTLNQYSLHISSELPKNKARIAQTANTLMEKQMQYNQGGQGGVEYITQEEWLMCQDIPIKELMMERMGIQRNADYLAQVSQILFQFTGLTQNGVDPNDAMQMVANDLQAQQNPASQVPDMIPTEEPYPQPGMDPGMPPMGMPTDSPPSMQQPLTQQQY